MKKSLFLFLALGGSLAAYSGAQVPTLTAVLLGAGEAPAAYDTKGAGFAFVTLDPATGTVTYNLLAPNLTNTTAAHIHRGPDGVAGPVVIGFANLLLVNGYTSGTVTGVSTSLINEILANPSGFYVNIHTTAYPGGAIRGRLGPAPGTSIGSCLPDQTTLCLTGRFKVQVAFQTTASIDAENEAARAGEGASATGVGTAIPLTGDTGCFWFFTPNNLELMIKVLDARTVNGKFWVFFGALSDVAYTITITDLTTGAVKTYSGVQGTQSSGNDTSAF